MKINYFGKPYSFTHVAALRRFGKDHEYNPFPTIDKTIEAVIGVSDSVSVVPIENSICGPINETVDVLCTAGYQNMDLTILEELELPIRLLLLSKNPKELHQIRKIYSHEYPLRISRNWIERNIPNANLEQVISTSEGIHRIQREGDSCAIASSEAAEYYGFKKLVEIKLDGKRNLTRFFVLGKN